MAKNTRYRKKRHQTSPTSKPFRALPPQAGPTDEIETIEETVTEETAATKAPKNNNAPQQKRRPGASDEIRYFPPDRRPLWPTEFIEAASRPYRLIQRDWNAEKIHLIGVFALVLLLYALTTPRLVTLEDDGLFIANMEYFGVAHPPGYPFHTFLGGIFYHLLPFGTPAFKGHFFSGFAGAIACSAVYACVIMLVNGRIFGYLAGVGYGASKTFWSQAIIAEVYTLNAALFFIILALCIKYASHSGRSQRRHINLLKAIAFIYGLGIATHYPILGLGTSGLFLLVLSQWRNILPHTPVALGFLFLGAAPPYAWMVWRSHDITPANFYGPIEDWQQFQFYVLRSGYSGVDKQSGVGIEDKIIFARSLADDMLWQYTPIGLIFIIIGFIIMARSRYNWMWLALATSWFTSSVLLVGLLDFKATFIWLAAFRVYHLLAYGIMAIWLAIGAAWFVDALRFLPAIARRQLGGLIALIVIGYTITAHWQLNNRREYRWAHDLAVAKINSIEPNSVLFLFDDLDLPVGYLHYVEGMRPDLTVYNDQGLVYGNRLYSPLIPDHAPENNPNILNKEIILRDFMEKTDRPIYHHPQRLRLYRHPRYGSDIMGFLRRVNRQTPQERIILSELLKRWLSDNVGVGDAITDLWTKQQHYSTVSQLINTIILASTHGFELDDAWLEIIERARENNAQARMSTTATYINAGLFSEEQLERELIWMEAYDIDSESILDKNAKAVFFSIRANIVAILHGVEHPGYEAALLEGIKRSDSPANAALRPLLHLYHQDKRYCEFIDLIDRYYKKPDDIPVQILRDVRQARQKAISCATAAATTT